MLRRTALRNNYIVGWYLMLSIVKCRFLRKRMYYYFIIGVICINDNGKCNCSVKN